MSGRRVAAMPLLDHFHPPLAGRRHWEGFHSLWAGSIVAALNAVLPAGYFAEPQVHDGPRIEADVATWDDPPADGAGHGANGGQFFDDRGGLATLTEAVPALAAADLTIPIALPPEFGVRVFSTSG